MGLFVAVGLEAGALAQLRRATTNSAAQGALAGLTLSGRVGGPSMLLVLASGIYLATVFWKWQGHWFHFGLLGVIIVAALGITITARRLARLHKSLNEPGSDTLALRSDPMLVVSLVMRALLLVGIVFLMTVKPGADTSLGVLGISLVAGVLTSLRVARARTRGPTAAEVQQT